MADITKEHTHASYLTAKSIYEGRVARGRAEEELAARTGMNRTSAKHYTRAYIQMRKGAIYKRNINSYSVEYFLRSIREDEGEHAYIRGLDSLKLHADYLERVTGKPYPYLLDLHARLLKDARATIIAPDDIDRTVSALGGDIDDEAYQASVNTPVNPRSKIPNYGMRRPRDPEVAKGSLRRAEYRCELGNDHATFTSRSTGRAFVEAHHLIPLGLQDEFEHSLDIEANIVALCPLCHRKIHYGRHEDRIPLLRELFTQRAKDLGSIGLNITLEELLSLYSRTVSDDMPIAN